MKVALQQLADGDKFDIYEAIVDGKSLFQDFYRKLDRKAKDRLAARIESLADNGPPKNDRKFPHEGDGIYAIKDITTAVRVYCFFHEGRVIIITHGFLKKYQKSRNRGKNNLYKALKIRDEFLKGGGR